MRISLCLIPLLCFACSQSPTSSSASSLTPEREAAALGVYAQRLTFTNSSELPIVGQSRTVASSDRIVRIVKEGEGYKLLAQTCRLRVTSDGPLKISFSDRNIQSLPKTESAVTLSEAAGALVITRPSQVEVIGARLGSENEALPLSESDPRLVDADQDGKPGLSAAAEAGPLKGQLYMVQRSINSYEVREEQPGVLQGSLLDRTEQVIVGASNVLLNAAKGKLALTPVPAESSVRMVKAPDSSSCADVEALLAP